MTSGYSLNNISTFVFNENLNINPTKRVQECELEELVKHGLRALRDTLPNEVVTYNIAHDTGAGLSEKLGELQTIALPFQAGTS